MRIQKHHYCIFALIVFCLFGGIINTYFASADNTTDFNVNISTVLGLSITQPDAVDIDSTSFNTLKSSDIVADVTTNNITGYTLTMSSDSTDLATLDGSIISTLDNTVSASNFTVNRWGISYDDGASYVPFTTQHQFTPTTGPANHSYTSLKAGVKLDITTSAGMYANTINFVAVANAIPVYEKEIIGLGTIQYDPGMTWGEWIHSDYNDFGLVEFETPNAYYGYCAQHDDLFPNPVGQRFELCYNSVTTIGATNSTIDSGPVLWYMYYINYEAEMAGCIPINLDQPIESQISVYNDDGTEGTPIPTTYVFDDYWADYGFGLLAEDFSIVGEYSHSSYNDTWGQWANDYNDIQNLGAGDYPYPNITLLDLDSGYYSPYRIVISYQDDPGIFLIEISAEELSSYDIDLDEFNFDAETAQVYQIQGVLPGDRIVDDSYMLIPIVE